MLNSLMISAALVTLSSSAYAQDKFQTTYFGGSCSLNVEGVENDCIPKFSSEIDLNDRNYHAFRETYNLHDKKGNAHPVNVYLFSQRKGSRRSDGSVDYVINAAFLKMDNEIGDTANATGKCNVASVDNKVSIDCDVNVLFLKTYNPMRVHWRLDGEEITHNQYSAADDHSTKLVDNDNNPVEFPTFSRVSDQANVLSPNAVKLLEEKSADLEKKTGIQFVIATVSSLEGNKIDIYANELFNTWKLGEKKKNNGVLLLVAPKEAKVRIEVGRGLEKNLPDSYCTSIIDATYDSFFNREYTKAIINAANLIITDLDPNQVPASHTHPDGYFTDAAPSYQDMEPVDPVTPQPKLNDDFLKSKMMGATK
jgi:hypothetical protein